MKHWFSFTGNIIRILASAIGIGARAFVALVGIAGVTAAVANYTMTQGAGTNFGSIVVSTVHYAQMLVCDSVTPSNCGKVQAGNGAATTDVALTVADPNVVASLATLNTTAGNPIVSPQNITPTDCSGTIGTGGTAQNAITAQTTLHGFVIKNIDASSGSGEPLWVSFTGTATANTAASYPLAAPATTSFANGESFTSPIGMGLNHAISIVGATTGHKYSCTWW